MVKKSKYEEIINENIKIYDIIEKRIKISKLKDFKTKFI